MAERLCFFVNNKNEIEEKYVSFDYVKGIRTKPAGSFIWMWWKPFQIKTL